MFFLFLWVFPKAGAITGLAACFTVLAAGNRSTIAASRPYYFPLGQKFNSFVAGPWLGPLARQDPVRRRVPALRSPGAMAAYLDSVLDFVSVELLGCALPRQKRLEPAVIDPG